MNPNKRKMSFHVLRVVKLSKVILSEYRMELALSKMFLEVINDSLYGRAEINGAE